MKKFFLFLVVIPLLLGASSAWAKKCHYHTVTKGECLWLIGKKYNVHWKAIQKINGLKSTVIYPKERLLIPDSRKEKRIWRTVGGNPYKGTVNWAISNFLLPKKIKTQVLKNIQQKKFQWTNIHSNMKISAVTFGRNRIWKNVTTQWDVTREYAAKDYGTNGFHVVKVLWCGNWAWWKEIPPSKEEKVLIPKRVEQELKPKSLPAKLLPIFKKEKTHVLYEHELDAGVGIWQNRGNSIRGNWWYAQYKIYLHNLEKNCLSGTLTPEIGLFAKGDDGRTDAGYRWNNWGIGPQAGLMWSGLTSSGYLQSSQLVFRTLWENLHGENSSSGYHKTENHFELGYYAEYLRRFAPDMMNVFYSEGWIDINKFISSSWKEDTPSNRTNFVVGYQLHKDWSDDWASRAGVQLGFSPEEHQWGLDLRTEARYDNWLMFGPAFDYTLASDVVGAAGSHSFGLFLRFELHKLITEKYFTVRAEAVQESPRSLLTY